MNVGSRRLLLVLLGDACFILCCRCQLFKVGDKGGKHHVEDAFLLLESYVENFY